LKLLRFSAVVVSGALALGVAACGDDDTDASGGTENAAANVSDDLSGSIRVDGSSTVQPVAEAGVELFAAEAPDVDVSVGGVGTGDGFEKFCRGELQIADASRGIEKEEYDACKKANITPVEVQVGIDGLTVVANQDLVFVGHGMRSNRAGAEQVADAFRRVGVPEVIIVEIPYGCGHIDGTINVIDRDLALVFPTQLSWVVYETMRRHGFRFLDLPSGEEAQMGMAINMVPLAPGVIVLPAGNPITKRTLEENGVECHEVVISELMKGGGAVHCMTGVIHRAPA